MPTDVMLVGVPMTDFSRTLIRLIRERAWAEGALAATEDPADLPVNPYTLEVSVADLDG